MLDQADDIPHPDGYFEVTFVYTEESKYKEGLKSYELNQEECMCLDEYPDCGSLSASLFHLNQGPFKLHKFNPLENGFYLNNKYYLHSYFLLTAAIGYGICERFYDSIDSTGEIIYVKPTNGILSLKINVS